MWQSSDCMALTDVGNGAGSATAKEKIMSNQPPEHTFRIGKLSASIWKNTREDGTTYYSTEIVRNYKDDKGEWKTTGSYSHSDLLNVARLAERAEGYLSAL
jgi:hypothetical protein